MSRFVILPINESERIVNLDNISLLGKSCNELWCLAFFGNKWWTINKPYKEIADLLLDNAKFSTIKPEPPALLSAFGDADVAIEYARRSGFKWVAKDKNGEIFFYKIKPEKYKLNWVYVSDNSEDEKDMVLQCPFDIPFINWGNPEPYCIGEGE